MKCFYHKSDLDGQCSGAIVKYVYPECEMFPIDYGDEFPWEQITPGERIFMVDFSLQPFKHMEALAQHTGLIWIDHHKTAIEEDEKAYTIIKGKREISKAACELTWEYLFKDKPIPRAVYLLGRYDVWDHEDPDTLPFQMGMRMENWNPTKKETIKKWERLFNNSWEVENKLVEGRIIVEYQTQQNKKYAEACAFPLNFKGLRFIAANALLTNSKLFDPVWDGEKHDAMLVFGWVKNKWKVSMYTSKPGIDVGQVAKEMGGGGHAGAAGFQCEELPFDLK